MRRRYRNSDNSLCIENAVVGFLKESTTKAVDCAVCEIILVASIATTDAFSKPIGFNDFKSTCEEVMG